MADDYKSQFNYDKNGETAQTDVTNSTEDLNSENFRQFDTRGVTAEKGFASVEKFYNLPSFKCCQEKLEIKKTARMIGLSVNIMLAISYVWSFVYIFVMTLNGYTLSEIRKFISEPAIMQVFQIVLSSFMFTVPFILVYKCFGQRISDLVLLGPPKKGRALPFFLFGISFCAFANIAVSQANSFFERFGFEYEVDFGENPKGIFGFLLCFISTVAVPAFVEEFACRGLILGALRKYGNGFAIICSSVIFGLMHGNFEQIPFAFLVGLVLGYVYVQTDTLWISVGIHAFNNFISLFFDFVMEDLPVGIQNSAYVIFITFCLLAGIFAVVLFSKQDGDYYRLAKVETANNDKKKYVYFFTTVLIIVFTVFSLIAACSYFII